MDKKAVDLAPEYKVHGVKFTETPFVKEGLRTTEYPASNNVMDLIDAAHKVGLVGMGLVVYRKVGGLDVTG